jgi:hypothetical protein
MEETGNNNARKLTESWKAPGNSRRALEIRAETGKAIALLRSLRDPAEGAVGEALYKAFKTTRALVDVDLDMKSRAIFASFAYPPTPGTTGFTNTVFVGEQAMSHRHSLLSALAHEYTHALQTARSAALHASPFNAGTDIILCPRDFVTACERMEQDAYAKQAWFLSLLRTAHSGEPDFSTADPVPVATFNTLRAAASGSATAAMRQAALNMLACPGFHSDSGNLVSLAESYHEMALNAYKKVISQRLRDNPHGLQFARMEDEDILAIGRSHGPALFGDDHLLPIFKGPADLSPANRQFLDELNMMLGITDEDRLPTLGNALAAKGRTRESLMAGPPAKGAPHGPRP